MVLKTLVTFGGVPLAGNEPVAWAFTAGTSAFRQTFMVRQADWSKIENMIGTPQTLVISDDAHKIEIKHLFALHEAPSDSPNRYSFEVADKRIWWEYGLISRDYNIAKKTGNRVFLRRAKPIQTPSVGAISADQYDYREYSLKNGKQRWTAQDAVKDLMEQIDAQTSPKHRGKGFRIDDFPIKNDGQFALQNVMLNDSPDVALGRLLSFIPGAAVYIDTEGTAVIYDGADLAAVERHYQSLPVTTYRGEFPEVIYRKAIRPADVKVYYQREVEVVFDYKDNYAGTSAGLLRDDPYVENVIPTTDPETTLTYFDPIAGKSITGPVPAGTWVPFREWLAAMELLRSQGSGTPASYPWTFETIRLGWVNNDLDAFLGGSADGVTLRDTDTRGAVQARINALKQHFRQTFRVNRRYMERVQDITAVRAGILNPHTGQPNTAMAWGQITIVSTRKGVHITKRFDPKTTGINMLMDTLPGHFDNEKETVDNPPLPLTVSITDADLGIFRIDHERSAYGTDKGYFPGWLEYETSSGTPQTHGNDLTEQNTKPMMAGIKISGGTNAWYLAKKMEMKFILSIVPGAPNSKRKYHPETVTASEIKAMYRNEYRIQNGQGPTMEVFIQPGEMAARFAWRTDKAANTTIRLLLGLNSPDPNKAGLPPGAKMDGFMLANDGHTGAGNSRHIRGHALAVAAEVIANYADALQGTISTTLPAENVKLVGNISSAAVQVAAYPSGEVSVAHDFPGQQAPISRMAIMPEMVRQFVLGIIPYRKGSK